jgi:isopenicillin-N epimerase
MPNLISPPVPLLADLRSRWMLKDGITFLNHGSFGAIPKVVFDAQTQWRQRIEAEPAKKAVGASFGMQPKDFGFVTNATEGVNAVLRSIQLSPGDELLTTHHVYHAVRQTMKEIARRARAVCREVAIPLPVVSSQQIADLVLGAISPKTRLLVIDHVTSPTALVFPVEQIVAGCREKGVAILIDGAHAPGMLPLNVQQIGADYYAANLHKWVCAPKGTAFLWVTPEHQAGVHPAVISHNLDQGLAKEFTWQGTRDLSSWLTAPTAINFMEDLAWDQVMRHNHQLASWAHAMLVERWDVEPISPLDGSLLGSMATVQLPGKLAELDGQDAIDFQQRLYTELSLELPVVRFDNRTFIRVSCHVYNVPGDYERLAEILLKIR